MPESSKSTRARAKRLMEAREMAGYPTPTDAARAMGVPAPTYLGHENGTTPITRAAVRYADFFKVSLDWLLSAKGQPRGRRQAPVFHYIGAGAEIIPVDDYPQGQGNELVDAPAWASGDCVAARIRGDSMHPLRDGWLVFWQKLQDGVSDDCIGQLCAVKVADGRMFLKDVARGSKPGTFTLMSWNAPPIADVEIEWATRIIDIRPG